MHTLTALCPESIQTTFNFKGGIDTDIAFKDLTIVSDLFDDIICPLFINPSALPLPAVTPKNLITLGSKFLSI